MVEGAHSALPMLNATLGMNGTLVAGADASLSLDATATAVPDGGDRKSMALVGTCTAMLTLALALRLAASLWLLRFNPKVRWWCNVPVRVWQHAFDVSVFVVLWYAISIGMTLFNKWFLRVWEGGYPFATTMTCINMFIKCLLSRVVNHCSASKMSELPTHVYWRLAVPIGLCTALDITFSNLSFFYITVTFYTVVKSGGNVWNLLFSIWLGHQRASFALFSVIILISSGIALASYGSTQFVMQGFLLVIAASIIGTLRWVLTQSLLAEMEESSNRILAVVYYISPASAVGLLPVALLSEGPDFMVSKFTSQPNLLFLSMLFIFVGGCLAFLLIFVEITLVKKTSALSLGIAGSFKDVTQVLLAVSIFGDKLSPVNAFGLMLATSGMLLYTYLKHSAAEGAHGQYSKVPTDQNADALDQLEDDDVPVIKMEEYNGGASSARPQPSELVRRESNADESFRHYSINNGSESDSGGDPDCQQV